MCKLFYGASIFYNLFVFLYTGTKKILSLWETFSNLKKNDLGTWKDEMVYMSTQLHALCQKHPVLSNPTHKSHQYIRHMFEKKSFVCNCIQGYIRPWVFVLPISSISWVNKFKTGRILLFIIHKLNISWQIYEGVNCLHVWKG